MDYIPKAGGCIVDNSLNKWNTIKNTLLPFYWISFFISVPLIRGHIILEFWNNIKGSLGILIVILIGLIILNFVTFNTILSYSLLLIQTISPFLTYFFRMLDITLLTFFLLSLTSILPSFISIFMPDLGTSLLPCSGLTGCINKVQLLIENPNLPTMLILGLGSFYFIRGGLRRF